MSALTIQDLSVEKTLDRQARLRVVGGSSALFGALARQYSMQRMLQKFTRRFPLPFAFAQTLALGTGGSQVQQAVVQQTAFAIGDNNRIEQNAFIVQTQKG